MSFNNPTSPHAARVGSMSQLPQPAMSVSGSLIDIRGISYNPNREYPENGRFYHAWHRGKYMLPCDDEESKRMDIFHKMFHLARGGKYLSVPVDAGPGRQAKILDLGCGTGIWAIDVADKYETAYVRGVDLSLIQPQEIPINVQFLQVDIEEPWQAQMGPDIWDVIHMRTLMGSIQDWGQLYAQIFAHLRPHFGYMEQVEIDFTPRCDDGSLPPNAEMLSWASEVFSAMDDHGRSMRVDSQRHLSYLRQVGFVDIKEEVIKVPINGWPPNPAERELGRFLCLGLTTGLMALTLAPLARMRGMSKAQVEAKLTRVKEEMADRRMHAYCRVHVWTARKPQ